MTFAGSTRSFANNQNSIEPFRKGKAYLFSTCRKNHKCKYSRFDIKKDKADHNLQVQGNWSGLWTDGPDASVNWGNGKIYFFKGYEYIRYDIKKDRADPKYPKPIKGNWPGLWNTWHEAKNYYGIRKKIIVTAAINWDNRKVYFFNFDQYIRYDIKKDRMDPGYPKSVQREWPGLKHSLSFIERYMFPETRLRNSKVNAAFNAGNGKAYFFIKTEYVRYDIKKGKVDSGYPKPVKGNWSGYNSNYVNAAVR